MMTRETPHNQYYALQHVDFGQVWQHILSFKGMIFLITFLFFGLSIGLSLLITPQYTAELIFTPTVEEGASQSGLAAQLGGIANLAGVSLGSDNSLESNLGMLKSRAFTYEFIQKFNLMPILFKDAWDEEQQTWKDDWKENPPTLWQAYKVFHKIRDVDTNIKTNLITLSITWTDPEIAAIWANQLLAELNTYIRTRKVKDARDTIKYLQQEIDKTNVIRMKELLYNLMEKQVQTITLAQVRDEYAFTTIDAAVAPEEKSKPKRTLIVLSGSFLGFFLSLVLAFLLPRKVK